MMEDKKSKICRADVQVGVCRTEASVEPGRAIMSQFTAKEFLFIWGRVSLLFHSSLQLIR